MRYGFGFAMAASLEVYERHGWMDVVPSFNI